MHIPEYYYKRIPKFYFIVGVLLVLTSFNMQGNRLGAILYFFAGVASVIYAISVHQARARRRKKFGPPPRDLRPVSLNLTQRVIRKLPANIQSKFINDNPDIAGEQEQAVAGSAAAANVQSKFINDNPEIAGEQEQAVAESAAAANVQSKFVNDNPVIADEQEEAAAKEQPPANKNPKRAPRQRSRSESVERDLSQNRGSIATSQKAEVEP